MTFSALARHRDNGITVRVSGDPAGGILAGPDPGKVPVGTASTTGLALSPLGKGALIGGALLLAGGALYLATSPAEGHGPRANPEAWEHPERERLRALEDKERALDKRRDALDRRIERARFDSRLQDELYARRATLSAELDGLAEAKRPLVERIYGR